MAKVRMTKETVEKVVKVEEKVYTLSLSQEELDAVGAVLARVGGSPDTTRRGLTQSVFDAIFEQVSREKGVDADKKFFYQHDINGHITFE